MLNSKLEIHFPEFYAFCLIGSLNNNFTNDLDVISKHFKIDSLKFQNKIKKLIDEKDPLIKISSGIWRLNDHKYYLEMCADRIVDYDVVNFKNLAIEVLSERDPQFDLPTEERWMANIHGKEKKYSDELREGLSNTLCLLDVKKDLLTNCTKSKIRDLSWSVVTELLKDADWVVWASLNNLLPVLAEASPEAFLKSIEEAVKKEKKENPFIEIFKQERNAPTGSNYMTGILWALETLAWKEEYIVRVCQILAKLHKLDLGGNYSNRPGRSLNQILLPWIKNTYASFEKKKAVVKNIINDDPDTGWDLVINLLPESHQVSFGTAKPKWREWEPENWNEKVTNKDYFEQISYYANLAVELSNGNIDRLLKLIEELDNIPQKTFELFLEYLKSDEVKELTEDNKKKIWIALSDLVRKHRKFTDAKWALPMDVIEQVEQVAELHKPTDLKNLHYPLFSKNAFELTEYKGNWEEQDKEVKRKRNEALKEILNSGGFENVLEFIQEVEKPEDVGQSFGEIANEDSIIIPEYYDIENEAFQKFTHAYIRSRFWSQEQDWDWVDKTYSDSWDIKYKLEFLLDLPLEENTWNRAKEWLKDNEKLYWEKVSAFPVYPKYAFMASQNFHKFKRAYSAINTAFLALTNNDDRITPDFITELLLSSFNTEEPQGTMDFYHIGELIKYLQKNPSEDVQKIIQIEWYYLGLTEGGFGLEAKFLQKELGEDPNFFMEIIKMVYKDPNRDKSKDKEPTEEDKALAHTAYKLLDVFKSIPGKTKDTFDVTHLNNWIDELKKISEEEGYWDIVERKIGKLLAFYPTDPSGLFMHEGVAKILNSEEYANMRNAFNTAIYNKRGVHVVDPEGKPEKELAAKWKERANEIENAGYGRVAVTCREIADSFERQAEWYIERAKEREL